MRIQQISVTGLFGIFNHVIPLNMSDRITIVHGPNGFGKTVMLRILNSFFNSRYLVLREIPFTHFQIVFDDSSIVDIVKDPDSSHEEEKKAQITFLLSGNDLGVFSLDLKTPSTPDEINFPLEVLNQIIGLRQVDFNLWRYLPTDEHFSFPEVLDRFEEMLPSSVKLREDPKWLEQLKCNIQVHLIESQRLLNVIPNPSRIVYTRQSLMLSTVSAYSNEIAQVMRDKFTEYGAISQTLDRTFPSRLVQRQSSPNLTEEQLRDRLEQLEVTRSRLVEVGLLDETENSDFPIQPLAIDESTKNILSVYVEDVEKKLSVFNDVASKIDLLRKIINSKFAYSYKEMSFNKEKGFVFKTFYNSSVSHSDTLSPTDLSSGEQHELVLLYELLFKVEPKALVLIDEPELSLHVGWQVQFLKDLQDIVKLADVDILMATHSPDIIQDRWDLTVELKGQEK
jgi:predicted ATP-binding protein involved in virulence